jgi:two-component system response regulator AtoC
MSSRRRRDGGLKRSFRTRTAAMRTLLATAEKALEHDVSILILGESGSGKGQLAAAIHASGPRRAAPFVPIDCASIPPELFESELFGYERGTFTDAQSRKLGKLELAQGGTVYFDEIAALAPNLQAKLLRALEERRFTRLGGHQTIALDARILSSSASPLASLRRDLLYRINVLTLTIPPLRERREDIPLLAEELLREVKGRAGTFDEEAMRMLCEHAWPGNVRELRNVVERAALLATGDVITPAELPREEFGGGAELLGAAMRDAWTLDELESRYIREVLRQTRSNYSRAAAILGINRKTLLEKRRRYGIDD